MQCHAVRTNYPPPAPPTAAAAHVQVAAGGAAGAQHAALLTRGGEVYTWGSGAGGKLGHGTSAGAAAPQQVRPFGCVARGVSGPARAGAPDTCITGACGVVSLGLRMALGQGFGGSSATLACLPWPPALPNPTPPPACRAARRPPIAGPLQVLRLFGKGAVAVACGHTYTAAVLRDGGLFTWGTGLGGQLGLGDAAAPSCVLPTRVPLRRAPGSAVKVELLSCGPYHLAAVSREGVLFTWGDGLFGKLGHGSHEGCASPRVVEALRGSWVVGVAAGWWHTVRRGLARGQGRRARGAAGGRLRFGRTAEGPGGRRRLGASRPSFPPKRTRARRSLPPAPPLCPCPCPRLPWPCRARRSRAAAPRAAAAPAARPSRTMAPPAAAARPPRPRALPHHTRGRRPRCSRPAAAGAAAAAAAAGGSGASAARCSRGEGTSPGASAAAGTTTRAASAMATLLAGWCRRKCWARTTCGRWAGAPATVALELASQAANVVGMNGRPGPLAFCGASRSACEAGQRRCALHDPGIS
jgi:hypothetical protein